MSKVPRDEVQCPTEDNVEGADREEGNASIQQQVFAAVEILDGSKEPSRLSEVLVLAVILPSRVPELAGGVAYERKITLRELHLLGEHLKRPS
jgi:hypothetical protein